jgi:hypothetical protein
VAAARYYFGTPNPPATAPIAGNTLDERVFPDVAVGTAGKSQVRFHRGTRNGSAGSPGTGSAGCVVSPDYRNMRRELALIYEREYQEYYGPGTFDDQLRKIVNVPIAPGNNDHGQTLYNTGGAAGLTQANYDDKLVGQFWLIRPDERPETGP